MTKVRNLTETTTSADNDLLYIVEATASPTADKKIKISSLFNNFIGKLTNYMTKTVYDSNNSGVVDNSEKLGGQVASYYTTTANIADSSDKRFVTDTQLTNIGTITGKATDTAVVHLAGVETITGAKTFNTDTLKANNITSADDFIIKTGSQKTLFLERACYRDEYPTPLVPAGGSAAPDQVSYIIGGVNTTRYSFDGNSTEERISGSFEIPHDYKTDGTIEVHIHWLPTTNGTGDVQWHFDWCYMGVGLAPQAQTTLSVIDTVSANQQYFHKIKAFGNLPVNSYALGDKILFTLRRTPNGASDTYGADAILEQIALHVPIDTLGSRQVSAK